MNPVKQIPTNWSSNLTRIILPQNTYIRNNIQKRSSKNIYLIKGEWKITCYEVTIHSTKLWILFVAQHQRRTMKGGSKNCELQNKYSIMFRLLNKKKQSSQIISQVFLDKVNFNRLKRVFRSKTFLCSMLLFYLVLILPNFSWYKDSVQCSCWILSAFTIFMRPLFSVSLLWLSHAKIPVKKF